MQKWEYLTLAMDKERGLLAQSHEGSFTRFGELGNFNPAINKLGEEGWEFAGTVEAGALVVFKRPKP